MKKYNTNWNSKKLKINFNEKQWRQDFAAFVKEKCFWDNTRVTRSRAISNDPTDKGIKSFEVFDKYNRTLYIVYKNCNEIISSTDDEIVKKYFEARDMK